jgi:hypothetical protein
LFRYLIEVYRTTSAENRDILSISVSVMARPIPEIVLCGPFFYTGGASIPLRRVCISRLLQQAK